MIKTPLSTMMGGAFWTPSATILGGASRTLNQIIKSLFSNNEQGFFYDPNDLSTMFQDAAGTVPVTGVGQAVGLVLDKSKGIKRESVPSSDLNTDGWSVSGTATWVKAANGVVSSSGGDGVFRKFSVLEVGALYKATITVNSVVSGSLNLPYDGSGANNVTRSTTGTFTRYFVAQTTTFVVAYSFNFVGSISNLTLEKVQGNSATQPASSMRPLLVASPQRLDYDTVDDKLITNLPTALTNCTVVRSVPNVGTQILTGQTIPATYEDNKDHCGLIVINRALTATETSQITKLFNKAAGV